MIEEDPNYIYSPNSDLVSVLEEARTYMIAGGEVQQVCPNDWLEVNEGSLPLDPIWGYSYQVYELEEEDLIVKIFDPVTEKYTITAISPACISNVYRRIPRG